ncbi:hypothetical protein [Flagellimonas baculiformis]|uniref:hypothetical protein n=1 Tax=Flagellimonas baculiformis TaxID=3067310 RepID=UPI00296FAE9C|nr:hypothetical protein [Muricauda sp. D6]
MCGAYLCSTVKCAPTAWTEIGFLIKHHRKSVNLIIPVLKDLSQNCMETEFYTIYFTFHQMMSVELLETMEFVREVLRRTILFRYSAVTRTTSRPKGLARSSRSWTMRPWSRLLPNNCPNMRWAF